MKQTGIVRQFDDLGRIVIPMDIRKQLSLNAKDPMEIYTTEDGGIFLKKFKPGCSLCGSNDNLKVFKGQKFCAKCVSEMKEEL